MWQTLVFAYLSFYSSASGVRVRKSAHVTGRCTVPALEISKCATPFVAQACKAECKAFCSEMDAEKCSEMDTMKKLCTAECATFGSETGASPGRSPSRRKKCRYQNLELSQCKGFVLQSCKDECKALCPSMDEAKCNDYFMTEMKDLCPEQCRTGSRKSKSSKCKQQNVEISRCKGFVLDTCKDECKALCPSMTEENCKDYFMTEMKDLCTEQCPTGSSTSKSSKCKQQNVEISQCKAFVLDTCKDECEALCPSMDAAKCAEFGMEGMKELCKWKGC
jgi:hypothetical protein